MSYAHILGSMYEHSSCMIIFLSYMINVDHGLYHDPYIMSVLMINILIAIMNTTYCKVWQSAESEWKYERTRYLVSFTQLLSEKNIFPSTRLSSSLHALLFQRSYVFSTASLSICTCWRTRSAHGPALEAPTRERKITAFRNRPSTLNSWTSWSKEERKWRTKPIKRSEG